MLHGAFDTTTEAGRSSERLRRIAWTAATGMMAKGFTMVIPLILVRVCLGYMGEESYGLWMTITGFFQLFAFADFGLGNGLLTKLSMAYGRDNPEKSRQIISSAFFLLLMIAVVLGVIFAISYPYVPWAKLFNAKTEKTIQLSTILVTAVILPRIFQLPFTTIQRIQLALQEGYWTNLWQCLGSVLSLVGAYIVAWNDLGAGWLVFVVAAIPSLMFVCNSAIFFYFTKPQYCPTWKHFERRETSELFSVGKSYFVLSVLLTLGLAVDNVIVAQVCGLQSVAKFAIVSRVTSIITMIMGVMVMPLWSANGEAMQRGDYAWIKRTLKKTLRVTLTLWSAGAAGLILIGPQCFNLWLGQDYSVSRTLLFAFLLRELSLCVASPFFMVLNGAGVVNAQIKVFAVFTIFSILIKIMLSSAMGPIGVPIAMVLCYSTLVIPIITKMANRIVNQSRQPI